MTIEVVAIASEVLSGFTINTNAAFISRELLREGFRVARHTVLPDNEESLREGLLDALSRNSLVIATGGLGPTLDDLTRKVAAELFATDFRYDEAVAADLKKRYGEAASFITDQATVPASADVLPNLYGTAPGLVLSSPISTLILLPGVPMEMRPMMTEHVLPIVRKLFQGTVPLHQKELHLFNIRESDVDPSLRLLHKQFPAIEYGIYPGQGTLTVLLTARTAGELEEPQRILAQQFQDHLFQAPHGKIEEAVHNAFLKAGKTLSLAESCTGGSIAAHLTQLPGASGYFLGSFVCYSNHLKTAVLHVPEEVLKKHGAVSPETARRMALGAQQISGSDFALAVTGIAGPSGGSPEKPIGTILRSHRQKKWRSQNARTYSFHVPAK